MKTLFLPFAAIMLAVFGISYSGCQESKADTKTTGSAARIKEEITKFEQLLKDLEKVQQANVNAYSQDMGVSSNSTGLELVSKQNEILDKYRSRLDYHRLQLIQADTTNETRNEIQIKEIETDITQLQADGEVIRNGLNNDPVNTKVTK